MMGKGDDVKEKSDSLAEVPTEVIEEYIKYFKKDFPNTIHIYSFIYVLLKWKRMRPLLDSHILSPNGDPDKGIFLFFLTENSFNGTVYAKDEESVQTLKEALRRSKRDPYRSKRVVLFTCMTHNSFRVLDDVIGPEWCVSHDTVYWLPWYAARETQIHLPEDVEIRELDGSQATQINNVWPHRYEESEEFIKEIINVNFGFGVFRGDKLLSWILFWFYGGLGVLQTEEAEKRKGYARAVCEAMIKRLGELQFDIHSNVVDGNKGAMNFFESLGFRVGFKSVWASRGLYKKKPSTS